ncbi:MAG: hypothetical protein ACI81T_003343 [Bacteroidia bacterium]|jgi:hypothetical protein
MRKLLFIVILTFSAISCKETAKSDSNVKTINIEDLKPGPIANESLSEEQLEKIQFIQKTFSEVYPVSLEETITNFKRDQNPDNEIEIWLNMAETFQPFVLKNQGEENFEARKEAFTLVLMRSMMPEKEAVSNSKMKLEKF